MKELVDKIKKIGNCRNCGGEYDVNGVCHFCNSENKEIQNLFSELNKYINNNKQTGINNVDNQLFRLKYYKEINKYLLSKNYYKLLKAMEDELFNKINSALELSKEELDLVQFLSVNSLDSSHKKLFGLYIILCNYDDKYKCKKEDFFDTVKCMTIEYMKDWTYIPKLEFKDEINEGCASTLGAQVFTKKNKTNFCNIVIKNEEIETLYNKESIIPLQIIFHELTHLIQESTLIEAHTLDKKVLIQIEDFVLSRFIDKEYYYNQNYSSISFETAAELISINNLINLLTKYNIKLKETDLSKLNKKAFISESLFNNTERMYKEKKYNIDDLFDTFIQTTDRIEEIFDTYPQLKYIYENRDGKYYRKPQSRIDVITYLHSESGADLNQSQIIAYRNEIENRRK